MATNLGYSVLRKKIEKRTVDRLAPADGKRTILWDTDIAGFCVRCSASGASKVYAIKYRIKRSGRIRWLTIGAHGKITASQARLKAREVRAMVELGEDPMEARDAQSAILSFKEAWALFMSDHIEAKRKQKTIHDYMALARKHILPAIGGLKLDKVGHAEIAKLHRMVNRAGPNGKQRPREANYTLAVLSSFFSWCLRSRLMSGENPASGIEKYPENKRERFLSDAEYTRLGQVLVRAEKTENPFAVAALRLLMLTGARKSEILTAQWDWVDRERQVLKLPDSKTGKKEIMLSQTELNVLGALPRLQNNPFIIAGHKPGTHYVNLQKIWSRIRKQAGLDDVRIHDLRHSFASKAAGGGMNLPVIGALLGHTQAQTTQRYAHIGQSPLRLAKDKVSASIAEALGPGTKSDQMSQNKDTSDE